ncbi:ferric-dicitrate binding protein FerR, regulates iron transport through sigma-19 [Catalinimonas alkaloidigena]|uniref:Ferric-dicitrate binding protein FerR, regulates iron transport through sigma-19 n=1 Tax=Catalinimonas alkaloidigena TaxID=1075417 RepID=A0A1G9GTE4_9BACT|nr:FecR domain-containing protein [Catalinimonas alkaloidigena]SDL03956.1 ferric-dicitrate binding protein FerR, regulates iron transport through sigma-19 [Catalinimonas alkaloidigena]
MKPDRYQLDDFIADPSFRNWVNQTNAADMQRWEVWLAAHPEKRDLAESAAELIRGLRLERPAVSPALVQAQWEALQPRLQTRPLQPATPRFQTWHMAAALALVCTLAIVGWQVTRWLGPVEYATDFGQVEELTLPDGSHVVLNGNSTLRLHDDWTGEAPREVFLTGEAFFEVTKRQSAQGAVKFIVHTDQLDVEVLGTEFNIRQREQRTRVVLESGKIRLTLTDQPDSLPAIEMQPGDLIEYAGGNRLIQQVTQPTQYSTWKERYLVFDNTPMREIIEILEQDYGLQVTVKDPALLTETLTGKAPTATVDDLLASLASVFEIKMHREDNKVYLE